jgi:DNA repair exonuclease SbcCD nuclease subunit
VRVLFVSDTHLGFDLPAHPRVERRRRGHDFFKNFELALEPALRGEVDVVLHGGDLLYRSRVPASLAWAALEPLKRVASRGVPVLLVLGNHERSRLPYPMFGLHERLHVFDRARTFLLEARGLRVAFAGFPYVREVRRRFREVLSSTGWDASPSDVRVLCVHHCVENATCGPGDFTFSSGDDVIRTDELPRDFAATLSGHIHRAQVLRPPGLGPVVYAGSVERTSFAEAPETKGYVVLELTKAGVERLEFRPLPARPMITLELEGGSGVLERARAAIESTPDDAVVQLRVRGEATLLTAALLRTLAGDRNVSLPLPRGGEGRRSTTVSARKGAPAPGARLPRW